MRLFVHHDAAGRIRSATWFDAPANAGMMLATGPGEFVAEVEGHRLKAEASQQAVRKTIRGMVVGTPAARATLVPAKGKPKKR